MEQHTYKAFAIPGLLYCTCLQNMGKSHVLHKLTTFLFCLHYMPSLKRTVTLLFSS